MNYLRYPNLKIKINFIKIIKKIEIRATLLFSLGWSDRVAPPLGSWLIILNITNNNFVIIIKIFILAINFNSFVS